MYNTLIQTGAHDDQSSKDDRRQDGRSRSGCRDCGLQP